VPTKRIPSIVSPLDALKMRSDLAIARLPVLLERKIRPHPRVAFIKGTDEQAYCGSSERAMQALRTVGAGFTTVDVLVDPQIRQELTALWSWPTTPQVFVTGRARRRRRHRPGAGRQR